MARKTAKGPAAGSDPVVEGIPEDAGPEDATAPLPKEKPLGSSKAVETMFRNATRAELELIALAATKANIMISLNGLIISALMISGAFIFAQRRIVRPGQERRGPDSAPHHPRGGRDRPKPQLEPRAVAADAAHGRV